MGAGEEVFRHVARSQHSAVGSVEKVKLVFDAGEVLDPGGDVFVGVLPERVEVGQVGTAVGFGCACGPRYDGTIPPLEGPVDPPTLRVLMDVQRRLGGLLADRCSYPPSTFGWEVPPSTYFTDLWTTASLVLLGWPASRHLAATR